MDRKSDRIKKILALFNHKEFLSVQEIVDRVDYSAATIRRDIIELEELDEEKWELLQNEPLKIYRARDLQDLQDLQDSQVS